MNIYSVRYLQTQAASRLTLVSHRLLCVNSVVNIYSAGIVVHGCELGALKSNSAAYLLCVRIKQQNPAPT